MRGTEVYTNGGSKHDMPYTTRFSVMRRRFAIYFCSDQINIALLMGQSNFGVFSAIFKYTWVEHFISWSVFSDMEAFSVKADYMRSKLV